MWPGSVSGVLQIVGRTAVIYVLVLVAVRLAGKREVGQMTPFDLVLLLLLSNSVQNAMTGSDTSLFGGLAAALTLFLLNKFVAEYAGINRRFRKFVLGSPSLLIHDGQVVASHMAKEHITMDGLETAMREHGICTVKDVSIGVLEVDGSISFLRYSDIAEHAQPHKRHRYIRKPE